MLPVLSTAGAGRVNHFIKGMKYDHGSSEDGIVHRVFGKKGGAIAPLVVECIAENTVDTFGKLTYFSFAKYGEMNGDMMRDPDVVLILMEDGRVLPHSYENSYVGVYNVYTQIKDGKLMVNSKGAKDLAISVQGWLKTWVDDNPDAEWTD